jgi:pyroglutamyl-peptidase
MRTVLITGFEPFAGDQRNPSMDVAMRLDAEMIAGRRVVGAVLPCVFGASLRMLERRIRRYRPEIVICLGLAGGRREITPERVAINVNDARIPDNAGKRPVDRPVVRGGPAAYFATLPIKAIVAALRERGVASSVSQTAGTFVCNQVFYGLMHVLRCQRTVRGGFVHVPFLPEQARGGEPSLPLGTMVEAIALAVEVSLCTRRDLATEGGQVH